MLRCNNCGFTFKDEAYAIYVLKTQSDHLTLYCTKCTPIHKPLVKLSSAGRAVIDTIFGEKE